MGKRLIDADALKRFILENGYVYANTLDTFPKVDAVEVVRCQHCRNAYIAPDAGRRCRASDGKRGYCLDDEYCSSGERKDGTK